MAEWKKVAKISDIKDDCGFLYEEGDIAIALVKVGSEVFAVDDMCTHADASLCDGMVDGDEIECPLHFARFNVRTGEVTAPPATRGIQTYPVRLVGDDVEVEL